MKNDLELKLQAWLDGELSGPEGLRLSREIAGDADATRLVEELRSVKSALAGAETPLTIPESREFYWSKIERQIARESAVPTPRHPVWLRWLSPVAGFAALAWMLMLAVSPPAPSTFDDISSTGEGMEAVTFHDQTAGMTVVWLADTDQTQPMIENPVLKTPDQPEDSEIEM